MPPWPLCDPFAVAGLVVLAALIPSRRSKQGERA